MLPHTHWRNSSPAEMTEAPTNQLTPRTLSGLHQAVQPTLQSLVPGGATVLDLGAGTGAWAHRLTQLGYRVTAVELERSAFRAEGVECLQIDLNSHFSAQVPGGPFDAISAIEVIEHLENPSQFLRECRALLKENGVLLLTTPNIQSVPARLRFLATGEIRMFGRDPRLNDPTHISPIHLDLLERIAARAGLEIAQSSFNEPAATATKWPYRVLCEVIRPLMKGVTGGNCHVLVLKPAGARASS